MTGQLLEHGLPHARPLLAAVGQRVAGSLDEILAFVFQLERAVAEGRSQPDVEIPVSHQFDPDGRRQG
jgi:hypothetical protein